MTGIAKQSGCHRTWEAQVTDLLAPHMHPQHFAKGTILWRRGDPPARMVLIRSGYVKVYRLLPDGRAITLFLFGPGDIFGFLPLVDGTPYPGTAEVLEDVEALILSRDGLARVVRADPDLCLRLVALLGQRLRAAMDAVEGTCTRGVMRRVSAALLSFVQDDDTCPLIQLPVSAQEFAGVVGVSPETVSRTLTDLEGRGILARQGRRRLRVLDLGRLRDVSSAVARS